MAMAMLRPGNPRDILATKYELEIEDVHHLKNLYRLVHEWLDQENFRAVDSGDDKIESFYLDRITHTGEKEHHIWWRTVHAPNGNSYVRYFIKIDWQTLYMKKIEVMHKGHKFKTNKGDAILRFEAWLQLDYQNKWLNNPILRVFDRWFRERFYLESIKKYRHDLYNIAFRLNHTVKQYMELKMPVDWGRPFWPERGVGSF